MLKILPENVLMNISSFVLGTPEQLRLKHNNTLRTIQNKCKFKIFKYTTSTSIRYNCYDEEPIRIREYGYSIRNIDNNFSAEQALWIMKGQCRKLMEMVKPYGQTDLLVYFNFYHLFGREDFLEKHFDYIDLGDEDDLLESMTEWIEEINRMDEYMTFKSIQFFFKNSVPHIED